MWFTNYGSDQFSYVGVYGIGQSLDHNFSFSFLSFGILAREAIVFQNV